MKKSFDKSRKATTHPHTRFNSGPARLVLRLCLPWSTWDSGELDEFCDHCGDSAVVKERHCDIEGEEEREMNLVWGCLLLRPSVHSIDHPFVVFVWWNRREEIACVYIHVWGKRFGWKKRRGRYIEKTGETYGERIAKKYRACLRDVCSQNNIRSLHYMYIYSNR